MLSCKAITPDDFAAALAGMVAPARHDMAGATVYQGEHPEFGTTILIADAIGGFAAMTDGVRWL